MQGRKQPEKFLFYPSSTESFYLLTTIMVVFWKMIFMLLQIRNKRTVFQAAMTLPLHIPSSKPKLFHLSVSVCLLYCHWILHNLNFSISISTLSLNSVSKCDLWLWIVLNVRRRIHYTRTENKNILSNLLLLYGSDTVQVWWWDLGNDWYQTEVMCNGYLFVSYIELF